MTSRELAAGVLGERALETHRRVHGFYAKQARLVRDVIRQDLDAMTMPYGSEFLHTSKGTWRIAMSKASDNNREVKGLAAEGARIVQALGMVSRRGVARGVISLAEFYELHGKTLNEDEFMAKVSGELDA